MFFVSAFPGDEYDLIMPISIQLNFLTIYTLVDFRAALDLIAYCEREMRREARNGNALAVGGYFRQAYVPARDGAMTIYHFGTALARIRNGVGLSPSLRDRVYSDELKEAQKLFDRLFPHYVRLRHGVAHFSDELGKINLSTLLSGNSPFSDLSERRFKARWKGEDVYYSLTDETRESLELVLTMTLKAFRNVYEDSCKLLGFGDP